MRGSSRWDYRPYTRLTETDLRERPYICRLAPYGTHALIDWIDRADAEYRVTVRRIDTGEAREIPAGAQKSVRIDGLACGVTYALRVMRAGDPAIASEERLFRTGEVPGVIVNYLHPDDKQYIFSGNCLCSPSLVRLPGGALIASMDLYASRHPQNLTLLFRSDDGGESWRYLCDLMPCYWGKLFWHRGALYMLAVSAEYGFLMIGRSDDEGQTWSTPTPLFPGCGARMEKGMHQAPTPVIEHGGRVWSAVDYGTWEMGGHASSLVSCPADADLLVAENWLLSEPVPFNYDWPGAIPESRHGCLEGNAVVSPEGEVLNMLRYQIRYVFEDDTPPGAVTHSRALHLKADPNDPEAPLSFMRFIEYNGGMSKFQIRFDDISGKYISLCNRVAGDDTPAQRNILSLSVSDDLISWTIVTDIIDGSDMDPLLVGFQYPDFVFDGADIVALSRTAMHGAANFHDANYITCHRIRNFRSLL